MASCRPCILLCAVLRITHCLSVIAFLPFDASSRLQSTLIPSSMLTGAWAVRIFVCELIP